MCFFFFGVASRGFSPAQKRSSPPHRTERSREDADAALVRDHDVLGKMAAELRAQRRTLAAKKRAAGLPPGLPRLPRLPHAPWVLKEGLAWTG